MQRLLLDVNGGIGGRLGGPVSQRGALSVVTSPSQLLIPAPPGVLSVMACWRQLSRVRAGGLV